MKSRKEKVVVVRFPILRKGEQKMFQVQLPEDAERIIGIESGVNLVSTPTPSEMDVPEEDFWVVFHHKKFKRDTCFGEFRLQSMGNADIFYAGHIHQDLNNRIGDYTMNYNESLPFYQHQYKALEEEVSVDKNNRVINGVYRDKIGMQRNEDLLYYIHIYVWYERKELTEQEVA